ncbi:hypothetical protein HBH53_182530 [Parastagonospora nodorum]|nr:hypothetical protein HBH53_182530 [Parastagonospora nodorum]KAH4901591.1 hypothetical protein HBI80_143370 [Parastagonospora nodorum]KAH4926424.1 hypothetical protein HBI79_143300 [Parastagonospora nodorum]KAH6012110.1 hypothetical protein HBI82_124950 [Parastagonospora nodorum]KAH6269093.1 hypothetical protein HBI41_093040 [Parastagonospora nodorum]
MAVVEGRSSLTDELTGLGLNGIKALMLQTSEVKDFVFTSTSTSFNHFSSTSYVCPYSIKWFWSSRALCVFLRFDGLLRQSSRRRVEHIQRAMAAPHLVT